MHTALTIKTGHRLEFLEKVALGEDRQDATVHIALGNCQMNLSVAEEHFKRSEWLALTEAHL
jgi:hypothetical protein